MRTNRFLRHIAIALLCVIGFGGAGAAAAEATPISDGTHVTAKPIWPK